MAQLGFLLADFLLLLGLLEPCREAIAPLELQCEVLGARQNVSDFSMSNNASLTYAVWFP